MKTNIINIFRSLWNHPFTLSITITLKTSSLEMDINVINTSTHNALEFTACFHNYLDVKDINGVKVTGLKGLTYVDKVDGRKEKEEREELLEVEGASAFSNGYVDRIYMNGSSSVVVTTGSEEKQTKYIIEKSDNFVDWVIFNPW
jgi:glucose-6-phosphate 1-epimerase